MYKKTKASLKSIDYKLFFTLLMMGFLPAVYTTLRVFFLGNMPDNSGLNIASQLLWINMAYEILQEGIMIPLFYILGKSLQNKEELSNKIITCMVVTFIIFSAISILINIFSEQLILFMGQKNNLVSETARYIKAETIALVLQHMAQVTIISITALKFNKILNIVIFTQLFATILFDTFLVSSFSFSMNMGPVGIAVTNIIVNTLLLFITTTALYKNKYLILNNLSFSWLKEWAIVGGYSGLESFVRNIAYILMISRMVNAIGEQGTFWVANNFIWGWLLLPILQLGQLIKRDCGENAEKTIKDKTLGYFAITSAIIVLWLISIPAWEPFIKNIMNSKNTHEVYEIVMISAVFYIFFAYNNVIDSIFCGMGKTNYMLFQSIITNTVFYGTLYLLYSLNIYKPTLQLIALMFGTGIAIDSVITYFMFYFVLKKKSISIFND